MEALILSCGTGGGHNAAAAAIANELRSRGHQVEILDPYALVGDRLAITISNAYIRLVQKLPALSAASISSPISSESSRLSLRSI